MLEPPTGMLSRDERVIFDEIMEERPPSHWTAHRRQLAAMLAKEMRTVAVAQAQLGRDGFVLTDGRGNRAMSPLARVVDQGIHTICAYRRTLAIHARALGGDARDIARRRQIRLQQQRDAPRDTDDLIAKPRTDGGENDRRL